MPIQYYLKKHKQTQNNKREFRDSVVIFAFSLMNLFLSLFLISCSKGLTSNAPNIDNRASTASSETPAPAPAAAPAPLTLPMVELTSPKEHSFYSYIYSTNFTAFNVKGICSEGTVSVQFAGKTANAPCVNKAWSANLDFSGVADGEWSVDVSIVNSAGKTYGTKRNFVKNQSGRQIYVNGDSGKNSNSGNESDPYLEVWKALEVANPGDVIRLVPRSNGGSYPNIYIADKAGLPNKLITIMGSSESTKTLIVPPTSDTQAIHIVRGSYIAIRNLDIKNPTHNCVSIDGTNTSSGFKPSHHIEVTDNFIHDCGENGIGSAYSDYLFLAYNEVTRSANVTDVFWGSAISTYANYYIDTFTGVKNVIRGNIIYSNTNKPKANCVAAGCSNSDGSGIIIDDLKNSQHATSSDYVPPYIYGTTVVENNVTYNNGGRGISIYSSNNVIVRSNTSFQNNRDPFEGAWRPGEINSESSSNIEIYNNITYSDGLTTANPTFEINTGAHVGISINNSANVKVAGNLTYNTQNNQTNRYYNNASTNVSIETSNEVWADPLFIAKGTSPSTANFQLDISSPALGMHIPGKGASTDYFNRIRAAGAAAGAY